MTGPILLPIFARPEKCQSGRMGLTRNQVCPHGYRGFESLLLRHFESICVTQICASQFVTVTLSVTF